MNSSLRYKHISNGYFVASALMAVSLVLGAASAAMAESAPVVLMEGGGVTVTSFDVKVEAQKIEPEARKKLLAQPDNVARIASAAYVRRVLATTAEKDGLAADPMVSAALQLARDKVLSDAVLSRFDAANTPSDAALLNFATANYKTQPERFRRPEEVRARHILVRGVTPESKTKAEALFDKLKAGADFSELARSSSDDAGSAAKGGDLGYFAKARMVKPFSDAAFALKSPGDTSEIIETQFGYHIIKLDERRPEGTRSFDEVKEALKSEILTKLLNDARLEQEQRLTGLAKYDHDAIEAMAASVAPAPASK